MFLPHGAPCLGGAEPPRRYSRHGGGGAAALEPRKSRKRSRGAAALGPARRSDLPCPALPRGEGGRIPASRRKPATLQRPPLALINNTPPNGIYASSLRASARPHLPAAAVTDGRTHQCGRGLRRAVRLGAGPGGGGPRGRAD